MEKNLYEDALMLDPALAVMVKEALEDGVIDRATADLAWWQIKHESLEGRHHS